MLNVEQGAYYSLDPIGAEIWTLLEEPASVQELVDRLQNALRSRAQSNARRTCWRSSRNARQRDDPGQVKIIRKYLALNGSDRSSC